MRTLQERISQRLCSGNIFAQRHALIIHFLTYSSSAFKNIWCIALSFEVTAAVKNSLLLALRRDMGGSSTQETAAYLNTADHKLGKALRMFKADKAWQGLAGGQ